MRIVEASWIVPMTILIMAALISLMMTFYNELSMQIDEHEALRAEWSKTSDTLIVRAADRIAG